MGSLTDTIRKVSEQSSTSNDGTEAPVQKLYQSIVSPEEFSLYIEEKRLNTPKGLKDVISIEHFGGLCSWIEKNLKYAGDMSETDTKALEDKADYFDKNVVPAMIEVSKSASGSVSYYTARLASKAGIAAIDFIPELIATAEDIGEYMPVRWCALSAISEIALEARKSKYCSVVDRLGKSRVKENVDEAIKTLKKISHPNLKEVAETYLNKLNTYVNSPT